MTSGTGSALTALVAKWLESRAPKTPKHVSKRCSEGDHGWCHNRTPDESHCQCACHYDKSEADKERHKCAKELARLVGAGEDRPVKEPKHRERIGVDAGSDRRLWQAAAEKTGQLVVKLENERATLEAQVVDLTAQVEQVAALRAEIAALKTDLRVAQSQNERIHKGHKGCGSCGETGCCEVKDCGYKWKIDEQEAELATLRRQQATLVQQMRAAKRTCETLGDWEEEVETWANELANMATQE